MERASSIRSPDHGLRHALRVMSCGGMIGTAILFPLAKAEGLLFGFVTLAIFIITTLAFHGLHIQPFVRFGPFTAAAALLLLLTAVLSAGPSRKELIPWLPIFIACLSLITVAIHKISQHMGPRRLSVNAEDDFSGVSIDTLSGRSIRSAPSQRAPPPVLESSLLNSLYFTMPGPPSRTSHRTGTTGTELSLSSVAGQIQPDWDPRIQAYFAGEIRQEQPLEHSNADPSADADSDSDSDSDSESETVEARRPLLESK
ncbi:hypothetical protein MMYC01_200552 [Madurella mycetomatis]|uniref:Uncharacterized protein n=1 Tax=Madurella mycetomatis TaxID=100816 RepID=A0A175WH15_9PEZI|nr:hypothetical protein MMYC01_200552 [Madurella mycetomatis]